MRTRWNKNPVLAIVNNHLVDYPSPVNVNYFWSLGSIAGICLAIQVISGVFLAMHYVPHVDYAFLSVEHIMRDVNNGWFFNTNGNLSLNGNSVLCYNNAQPIIVNYITNAYLTSCIYFYKLIKFIGKKNI